MLDPKAALVLLSGGQDSTTCLAWALERFESVETIGFEYGQRHAVEMTCRLSVREQIGKLKEEWQTRLGRDCVLDASMLSSLTANALTGDRPITTDAEGLPTTFVPGRNLFFLTLAAVVARQRNIKHIITGVCETDYSGYPDCRDDTIKAIQLALNSAMARQFVVHTPLMWIDKAATFEMARQLGGRAFIDLIMEHTHTCYQGERRRRHAWGYGCDECPACELRRMGYVEWGRRIPNSSSQ